MKRNTFIILLGYLLLVLAVISFVLALHMETGFQFWIMTFVSIGYMMCSGFVFDSRTTENGPEGF
jgi:uncharacterized membrane protein